MYISTDNGAELFNHSIYYLRKIMHVNRNILLNFHRLLILQSASILPFSPKRGCLFIIRRLQEENHSLQCSVASVIPEITFSLFSCMEWIKECPNDLFHE